MPDDLELPADLIDLQAAYEAAQTAVAAYAVAVAAERRELFPDPVRRGVRIWDEEQAALRNDWPQEQLEELERLRAASRAAREALWHHPAVEQALGNGGWKRLHIRLKQAVGVESWLIVTID